MKPLYSFLLIAILSLISGSAQAKSEGYQYVIKNYFQKRQSLNSQYKSAPRNLSFYIGGVVLRETKEETLPAFSSYTLGFRQRIKEIYSVGDINLKINLLSAKFEEGEDKAIAIEVIPEISLPDARSGFPFYVGLGGGIGLYPRHVIKALSPKISFNTQAFAGVRFLDLYHNLGLHTEVALKLHWPVNDLKLYLDVLINAGLVFSF